jgi:stearoyl-CoA desaturase (delta-9 desaturase)
MKWICTLIALLSGRGSPIGWVYVHRIHHAYSDTEKDPHSPINLGFKLFGFKHIERHSGKMNYFLVKDLMNPTQIKINEYYFLILLAVALLLSIVSPEILYFVWVLPVFLIQLSQNSFNYFAHKNGYRNFDTKDNSTNNVWLWPLILGDAWHNNHHANAARLSTKVKPYEFDPASILANLIKK